MVDATSRRAKTVRLSVAGLLILGFLVLYAISNLTAIGQWAENSLLGGYETQTLVWFPYDYLQFPPFEHGGETVVAGLAIAVLIAAVQRRWRDLAIVAIATPVAVLATQAFKDVAGRPRLVVSPDVDPSYPSGHFAVAAAVTLALLIVVPRTWLRWCAPLLLAWTVMIGAGVLSMGWHRSSDVMGGALLVSAVFLIVGALLASGRGRIRPRRLWSIPAAIAIASVLVVVAVASAWKPMLWTVPIFAIVSLLSTALVGRTAFQLCGKTPTDDVSDAEGSDTTASDRSEQRPGHRGHVAARAGESAASEHPIAACGKGVQLV